MLKKLLFLVFAVGLPLVAFSQQSDTVLFQKKTFEQGQQQLLYRIMYPKNFNANKKYPLLIFLHGAGERGNDNTTQLRNGGQWLVDSLYEKYPAIVIAPQCPENDYWAHLKRVVLPQGSPMVLNFTFYKDSTANPTLKMVMALINQLEKSGNVDKKREYVCGLSMGGMGTYELLTREPKKFAAAFVICGAVNIDWFTEHNKKTPLWIFHGADDQVVSVNYARNIYKTLNNGKREVKYTEYPGVNHNSWDNVFQEPDVFQWLFSHKK